MSSDSYACFCIFPCGNNPAANWMPGVLAASLSAVISIFKLDVASTAVRGPRARQGATPVDEWESF